VVRLPQKKVGDLETVDDRSLAEPDRDALEALLRSVVAHPSEARAEGRAAREHILRHCTWNRAAEAVEARIRERAAGCRGSTVAPAR
jgi:hypothetical protein